LETLMKTRLLLLLIGFFALESACLAQGSKPGKSAPGPGPTTTAGDPTKYLNRDWENVYNQGRTGDHLRGNVTLAEGALPWDAIPVVVMCDGKAKFTTTTDSHGDFVIARVQPVASTTIIGTEKSLVGQLVGCSVSAVLPGFDSSQLTIANRDVLAHPNIGTITLKRESGAAGTAVSTTTATAPKSAMKSFEKARSEWLDNKPGRAQRGLQRAVEIYPQFAEAWYQLGKIQEKLKSPAARESFSKAVAADPEFALPYERMVPISAQAEKWAEVIDETNRALELNPRGTLDLWYYNALGNYHRKSLDMAETSANKSFQEMRPGMLTVDEYLGSGPTHASSPGGITTKGLPALLLIFHPYDTSAFSMKCEGLVYRKGQPTWQVYFRQRADKPNTTRSYSFGPSRRSYLVALKGRAWFAADSYQIVSLQTDLIAPMPDIQLTVDRADIEYGPVHFSSKAVDMWVPQTAELYSDLRGKKVHQRMNFGNYLLFSVDDKYKIAAPKSQQ
jgi:hypothetical protein